MTKYWYKVKDRCMCEIKIRKLSDKKDKQKYVHKVKTVCIITLSYNDTIIFYMYVRHINKVISSSMSYLYLVFYNVKVLLENITEGVEAFDGRVSRFHSLLDRLEECSDFANLLLRV